jgi:HD-GYP domain-containing protein (c-di-GMP phosphodiesterase class II)/DNA-binding CsgD family transcriptional regulator
MEKAEHPPLVPWLAGLTLAMDLANGAPDGTALRGTLLAAAACEALGVDETTKAVATWSALFRYLGCTSYALEEARVLGDEHRAARLLAPLDKGDSLGLAKALVRGTDVEGGESLAQRGRRVLRLAGVGHTFVRGYEASHCEGAVRLASRLSVVAAVTETLSCLHERWDGRGGPRRLRGEDIPLAARIVHAAREAAVQAAIFGVEAVRPCLQERKGGQLDPAVVRALTKPSLRLLDEALLSSDPWEATTRALEETFAAAFVRPPTLDEIADVFGDFSDAKCPIFLGHSGGVGKLAVAAAEHLATTGAQLPPLPTLRRAARLLDIGRVGVPVHIWMKPGAIGPIEWERVRLHTYHGERICQRLDTAVARLVGEHHERADSSGYARGVPPSAGGALLGAVDTWVALSSDRPHRPAFPRAEATRIFHDLVARGLFSPVIAEAVLAAASGERPPRAPSGRPPPSSGLYPATSPETATAAELACDVVAGSFDGLPALVRLTNRERDVLRLVARGLSNKEVASELGLSPRTVQAHTIAAYDKLGVRTRAGAAIRATELGLFATG